jgi:translation initiation factor 2B subunit (eIF-2B alpha/beta/delta family)
MKRHQITKVLMGAHTVYMENGKMIKFINTSGSDMLLREAKNYNVPVFIIAEKNKCKPWTDSEELVVAYLEKKFITKSLDDEGIDALEVAYDLCDANEYVSFVCEDGVTK